jgi:transcriptional regulator with PAS, ATPase and Fis domain
MRETRERIALAARTELPVLIEGETGSGKEVVAREIHLRSRRAVGPWVVVDCVTYAESLLESELFGHGKGAFTGAVAPREGRLQEAHGGTLFFDEIGSVGIPIQAKLLRFLETGEFPRVGEKGLRRVDCRIVAATSQLLEDGIRAGRVRPDFYFRLRALYVWVPPLRERKEDIPLLADHFLREAGVPEGAAALRPKALEQLTNCDWPGNVRELRYALLLNVARVGKTPIEEIQFPTAVSRSTPDAGTGEVRPCSSLRAYLRQREREFLLELIQERGDSLSEMADAADVSIRTLQRRLRFHGLRR